MSLQNSTNSLIPKIEVPESLRPILGSIVNKMTGAVQSKGMDLETGKIPFPISNKTLEKNEFIAFAIFDWITNIDEIVENLNIVISDLRMLANSDSNYIGSPYRRFYLLLRTYFNEFFRFKELFNNFIKTLEINNVIDKDSANILKKTFYEAFKISIGLRNKLVHTSVNWEGKKHQELTMIWGANLVGFDVFDKKSGKIDTLQNAIKDIADDYIKFLIDEGNRMRLINQKIIDFLVNRLDHFAVHLYP